MKKLLLIFMLALVAGCTTTKNINQPVAETSAEEKYEKLFNDGYDTLLNGHPRLAIEKYFDPVIEYFEQHYRTYGKRVYSARGLKDTMLYMITAAADNGDAIAISGFWSEAYYHKGYAKIELGYIGEAKDWINKALELSPSHSRYMSELGHIYQIEKKWTEALEIFLKAEENAEVYTPDSLKDVELSRAKRGIGFSLIELGRLDEAEEKFKECLEIDENDQKAKGELSYIRSLREKFWSGKK